MTNEIKELYNKWQKETADIPELAADLRDKSDEEIFDRFYRELEFGTGGLRGVLGAGTNRMNIFTVARASLGIAEYLLATGKKDMSVAIAYDSRINSDVFAKTTAEVFATKGIKVYLYPVLMPTPALSYAVRQLGCDAGVVITASHNPAKYNGYKLYGADGCQITLEVAEAILSEINRTPYFEKFEDFDALLEAGKINYTEESLTDGFIADAVKAAKRDGEAKRDVKIVYTPLNGSGLMPVTVALTGCGFEDVTVVPEQMEPDGNFPTCPYPNPEIVEALGKGLELARETGADLLLATDPDCDRVGTAVPYNGDYRLISGNEMGILLLDYICATKIAAGTMPKNPVAIKSIVTTDMTYAVAKKYGVELIDVLTGFKFIGEQIALLEEKGEADRYIFGFEESYGYLCDAYVRDKDGVSTSVLICEMTDYYRAEGKSLAERIDELYSEFGFFKSSLESFTFEGSSGMKKMASLMDMLRNEPPAEILGNKLLSVSDYEKSLVTAADGSETVINLPKSNVIKFSFENDICIVARPSGTEPKLKAYYTVKADSSEAADKTLGELMAEFKKLLR